jgi:hypothetical protein
MSSQVMLTPLNDVRAARVTGTRDGERDRIAYARKKAAEILATGVIRFNRRSYDVALRSPRLTVGGLQHRRGVGDRSRTLAPWRQEGTSR